MKCGEEGGGIVTSCSGRVHYQIGITNVKGQKAAVSRDVVVALCQKVVAWQKLSSPDKDIHLTASSLEARTLYGPVPDYATVSLVARFKDPDQGDALDRGIRRIARRNARDHRVHVAREVYRAPVIGNDAINGFFRTAEKLARRLGVRVEPVHRLTSSDICFVPDGIPILDGMGPVGGQCRSPDEYVSRDSMIDRTALLARLIHECSREDAP